MRKAILLHSLPFHYEMIGSILHHFSHYSIDILSLDNNQWHIVYSKLFKNYNCIHTILDTNYDLCILDTDDDINMCNTYNKYFQSIPIYIINHIKDGNRSTISDHYKKCINIHGIQHPSQPFHFCGYKYIQNTQDKLKLLSNKITVTIIGDIINTERYFFKSLINRISNFENIDFHVINRRKSLWALLYPNIHYHIDCTTQEMFNILERSHYIYFFADTRGKYTSSACFGLAYSTLCRLVCSQDKKDQYEITSPLFQKMDNKFTLEPVSKEDIENVEKERDMLLSKTSTFITKLLNN